MSDVHTLPAFAKINWVLRVLGRRPDQYHEIETVLQTVSLHDRLSFSTTSDGEIDFLCDDSSLPTDDSNLVVRAALELKRRFAVSAGARISLEKRIPIGGGLGGGSSDAAVTLLGLNQIWQIGATAADLNPLAAELGADVPFFLSGGTALGQGTGTRVSLLPETPPQHLLVLMPNVTVSTKTAYESLNAPALTTVCGDTILSSSRESGRFDLSDLHTLQNDFQPVVLRSHPEIERARTALLKAGASTVLLSGSGASVFGICENEGAQERAIQAVKMEAGWRLFPCQTVARDEYVGRAILSVGSG